MPTDLNRFTQTLDHWSFRVFETDVWQPITVPGCWEHEGVAKDCSGPITYRTLLHVPGDLEGRRLWLHFGGASYCAAVFINGQLVGEHTGMWDAFRVEITGFVKPSETATLTVSIEKPASLTAGPDSQAVPGRFHTRETLSGFLPYVWGHVFGGLWQAVRLEATGVVALENVWVRGTPDGRVTLNVQTDAPSAVGVELLDTNGVLVAQLQAHCDVRTTLELGIPDPRSWSPLEPQRYTARITLPDGDGREIRFGLRTLETRGTDIVLNGTPIYLRMILNWGWYPESLHSNPGAARVRADLERLKSLGFNGVKFCLWFPPQYFFDLCDELGLLVWLELPMWLTQLTPVSRAQIPVEYARLVAQARNHPAVIVYTLGCELNKNVGADFLEPLYTLVKSMIGDALLRDNSGSGEAYGGLLNEFADFYDYHFYCELHEFRDVINHFAPRWRPVQPLLFGEYADSETWRDLRRLEDSSGNLPWWCSSDQRTNPQGARWQYDAPFIPERARANGLWTRSAQLEEISCKQALLHRKFTLEATRLYSEVSGYVITGEADTPISTAGLWDDAGGLKFDAPAFRAFNDDLVVLVGWDRRRAWVAGGDRAARWDAHSYMGGSLVRPHAVISNYSPLSGSVSVAWSAAFEGQVPFASGEITSAHEFTPGDLREVGVLEFTLPEVDMPRRATLRLGARLGARRAVNTWPLWVYPPNPWAKLEGVALLDPEDRLSGLRTLAPQLQSGLEGVRVVVATAWTPELRTWLEAGGRAVVIGAHAHSLGALSTVQLPFWREAVKIPEPHPAWGAFPHEGWCDLQFFGMAPDHALETATLKLPFESILCRADARTAALHHYAISLEVGAGRAIFTTLNFAGDQGDQPVSIAQSPSASFLLHELTRWCRDA